MISFTKNVNNKQMNYQQCQHNQRMSQNDMYLFTIKILVGDREEMNTS